MDGDGITAVPERISVAAIGCSNDVVLGLADRAAPEHTALVARLQFAARGGSGPWEAPLGGLWFTTLWRPRLEVEHAALITLAATWGVREGILRHTGLETDLKWPNDVLCAGRKLAGVLVEGRVTAGVVASAAIAVGINVNNPPQGLPAAIRGRATSLASETGTPIELDGLFEAVADALRDARGLVDRPTELVRSFTAAWAQRGRAVAIDIGHALLEGVGERIDPDGALVIRADGVDHRVDDPSLAKFVRIV